MARPACPAPITTVVTVRMRSVPLWGLYRAPIDRRRPGAAYLAAPAASAEPLSDFDCDIRRIGHDVVDRRPFLRLRNEGFDVFALGIGVDLVHDLDPVKAITHIAVDAQDALNVHVPFNRRLDGTQLDIAVLCD